MLQTYQFGSVITISVMFLSNANIANEALKKKTRHFYFYTMTPKNVSQKSNNAAIDVLSVYIFLGMSRCLKNPH